MKYSISIIMIMIIFSACQKEKMDPQNIDEAIENIAMPYIVSGERVGIAIGTFDNGVKKFYSYGVKHLQSGGLIDENTMFEIGSISKTFTTTVLAKLHIKGEVNIDDKLQDYFLGNVNIPQYGNDDIKLKHIANHTSSLPREPENLNTSDEATVFQDYSINDFHTFINSYVLTRAIGSEFEYSNLGVGILGYVLKEQQQKTYLKLVEDEILIPLGMQNTVVDFNYANTNNIAQGYVGNVPKPQWILSEMFEGAGALKSNTKDMLKYLEAQFTTNSDTLSQAISLAHQKTGTIGVENDDVALGWIIRPNDNAQDIIWHTGGTGGYNAFIGFNKSTGKGVVILMNTKNSEYAGEAFFGHEIMSVLDKY